MHAVLLSKKIFAVIIESLNLANILDTIDSRAYKTVHADGSCVAVVAVVFHFSPVNFDACIITAHTKRTSLHLKVRNIYPTHTQFSAVMMMNSDKIHGLTAEN